MQAGFFKRTILPGLLLLVGVGWLASATRAQSEMTIVRTAVSLTASDQSLLPGQQLKLTASVTMEDGGEVPGGFIEFIDETQEQVVGRTDASAPWIVLHHLSDGSHTFRARYSGLQSYFPFVIDPSTSAPVVYTARTVPRVVISSSQNPSVPGQAVTLTVAVKSRDGIPKGDVTIRDVALDSILADRVMLDSNGMASFTTSGLEQGSRTIVASYHGDTRNKSATSTQLMQIVSPAHAHGLRLAH
jgi:hypothetical protein